VHYKNFVDLEFIFLPTEGYMVLSEIEQEMVELMRSVTVEGQKRIVFWAAAVLETERWMKCKREMGVE
jgi:translation initiation factor 2 alpha subunit (eIF-2alpha)